MMRIKLFALFIAFALVALVRPRKMLELLEAADAGAKAAHDKDLIARQNALVQRAKPTEWTDEEILSVATEAVRAGSLSWLGFIADSDGRYSVPVLSKCHYQLVRAVLAEQRIQECPLPPAGWRCTRRAGYDGPCAAVAK